MAGPRRGVSRCCVVAAAVLAAASALAPAGVSRRHVLGTAVAAPAAAAVGATTFGPLPAAADVVVDKSAIRSTKGGVKYVVAKEGACPVTDPTGLAGSCYPKQGSFCVIDYTGFLPDGKVFDTTERKGGKPLAFRLGEKQVIVGIEQVVSQMLPGEEVQALIPADLAYGAKGVCTDGGECLIPPNSNLKYFIKLIRVASAQG